MSRIFVKKIKDEHGWTQMDTDKELLQSFRTSCIRACAVRNLSGNTTIVTKALDRPLTIKLFEVTGVKTIT